MRQKTKQEIQIEQQFIYTFAKIVESFPQYTLMQHLVHFMRRKNEVKEVYDWSDALGLQKIAAYYDELTTDLLTNTDDEDYDQ